MAIHMSLAFSHGIPLKFSISLLLSDEKASSSETETQAHRCSVLRLSNGITVSCVL